MVRCIIVSLVSVCLLAGCATSAKGPRFEGLAEPKLGYSLLYIYRPHDNVGRWVWHDVFLNNTKVVGLLDGSFTYVHVQPGKYSIHAKKSCFLSASDPGLGEITVEPDSTQFLLFDRKHEEYVGLGNPMSPFMPVPKYKTIYQRWTVVEKDQALPELSQCKFVQPYVQFVSP